jgi:hypothetical protein
MSSTDTSAPSFADLSRDLLEAADLEVVTSLVELPPSFQLPTHRHPGEEFAYVIDGAIYFWEHGADGAPHAGRVVRQGPAGRGSQCPHRRRPGSEAHRVPSAHSRCSRTRTR